MAFGKLGGRRIVLASVYFDILDNEVIPKILRDLITYVDNNSFSLILGIDSNAHSPLYGNDSSPRGDIVEEFILANQLCVQNTGRVPTFQSANGQSIIDVTLTKNLTLAATAREKSWNEGSIEGLVWTINIFVF